MTRLVLIFVVVAATLAAGQSQTLAAAGVTLGVAHVSAVPEPITMLTLATGIGGLSAYFRRRLKEKKLDK